MYFPTGNQVLLEHENGSGKGYDSCLPIVSCLGLPISDPTNDAGDRDIALYTFNELVWELVRKELPGISRASLPMWVKFGSLSSIPS